MDDAIDPCFKSEEENQVDILFNQIKSLSANDLDDLSRRKSKRKNQNHKTYSNKF